MVLMADHGEGDDFVVATGKAHSVRDFVEAAFVEAGIEDWERHIAEDEHKN
jgi:GDPmannose 4,6-dehydratase